MTEPPKVRLFVSELKTQLEVIDSELQEIRNRGFTDAWGTKVRTEDVDRFQALIKRRKTIIQRIIDHEG